MISANPAPSPVSPRKTFIKTFNLVDRVTETIQQRIAAGELEVGKKMPSAAALSLQVGASIAVVREALSRLRTLGLIETRHGSGSVVIATADATAFRIGEHAAWEPTLLAQLFEFRIDLETASAAHAAVMARASDLVSLRAALRKLERTVKEKESGTDADLDFHLAIARSSNNKYRVQLIEYLNREVRDAIDIARRNSARRPGLPDKVHAEHEAVLRAIEKGDGVAAGDAMRHHLASAAERLALPIAGSAAARAVAASRRPPRKI